MGVIGGAAAAVAGAAGAGAGTSAGLGALGVGLQAAGGLASAGASRKAASAYDEQASIAVQLGQFNRDVIYAGRAESYERQAEWIKWQGAWEKRQLNHQARQVEALAELELEARYLQADYQEDLGRKQKQSFDYEADNLQRHSAEQRKREVRQGELDLGTIRNRVTRSGVAETGSALAMQTEQWRRLATREQDLMIRATEEMQRQRYAGEMAQWEGDVGATTTRYNAQVQKFLADSDAHSLRTQAYMTYLDAQVRAQNARFAAEDTRQQGRLEYLYSLSQAQGYSAQAAGARSAATAEVFGALGGAATGFYKLT